MTANTPTNTRRRQVLTRAAALAALATPFGGTVLAQARPPAKVAKLAGTLRIVIPANAGGGWDQTGRALGAALVGAGASPVPGKLKNAFFQLPGSAGRSATAGWAGTAAALRRGFAVFTTGGFTGFSALTIFRVAGRTALATLAGFVILTCGARAAVVNRLLKS